MPEVSPPSIIQPPESEPLIRRAAFQALGKKIARIWRTVRQYFPLTSSGVAIAVVGYGGWLMLGLGELDLVVSSAVYALGWLAVALLLGTLLNFGRLLYKLKHSQLSTAPFKLESGCPRTSEFVLQLGYFPGSEVKWFWEYPSQVTVETVSSWRHITEKVNATQRFQAERITRVFVVGDILGLTRLRIKRDFACQVTAFPPKQKFSTNQILPSISEGSDDYHPYGSPHGDRIDMRKYGPGDSAKDIIWKVYARTRKLMVRTPENSVTAQPRSCAYLVAGDGDAISASLARTVLESHALGDNWAFGSDGTAGLITNISQAILAISRSGNYGLITPQEAKVTALSNFLREARLRGYNNCLVFVPSRLPLPEWPNWVREARSALGDATLNVVWIIGIEKRPPALGAVPDTPPEAPLWQQTLKRYALHNIPAVEEQALQVGKILSSETSPVWLYESLTNRFLTFS